MVLSIELKMTIIEAYFENGRSPARVRRLLLSRGSKWSTVVPTLSNQQIKRVVNQLQTNYTLKKISPPGRSRSVISNKNLDRIKKKLELSPRRSVRSLSRELGISKTTTWRMLRKELKKFPYKIQLREKQTPETKEKRVDFANFMSDRIESDKNFLQHILFSDEAHFHLSGYVNRQNMRFWGSENPHDSVEAPKTRARVTVFVALGQDAGLIGPYFFEDKEGVAETIKTDNYIKLIKGKLIPALKRKGNIKKCIFQQDGAPPHCSRVAIDWLTEKFGEERLISRNSKFLWPPYSPDLNPLDFYFWGYLKSKVYTNPYPRTVDELKLNIRRECRKIGKIQISSAINNLNSRLQYVLAKKGGYFEQILNY